MATDFTFGQIEAVCSELNRIAPDKRVAFVGRLKQLQKQGLTDGRPGRGKAGVYSFGDLMRFVVAVELMQAGVMPQRAAGLIHRNHRELQRSVAWWFASETPDAFYWVIKPEELAGLTEGQTTGDDLPFVNTVTIETIMQDELADAFASGLTGDGWRTLLLNGSSLIEAVIRVVGRLGYATVQDLRDALQAEGGS